MRAMKPTPKSLLLALAGGLFATAGHAADAPAAPVPDAVSEAAAEDKAANEPAVRRTVIDDRSNRIEELRVRGQLQKVTVDPKGGAPSYEIIVVEGARDTSDAVMSTRGAAGKRVWNIFRF